ncbi:MAG: hypothetical protein LUC43_01665, partial [Burkholderiales bacterium]|nr:hypothetical protein [Burkholderiales bacterium]
MAYYKQFPKSKEATMWRGVRQTTSTIFCALALGLCFSPLHAQSVKQILGVIDPGKTTLAQFEYALRERGCTFDKELGGDRLMRHVRVDPGCFDLPGDPVMVAEAESENMPVEDLVLTFKDNDAESFLQLYSNALEKAYGQPNSKVNDVNQLSYMWRIPERRLVVDLSASRETHDTQLKYFMGILATTVLERWQHEVTT